YLTKDGLPNSGVARSTRTQVLRTQCSPAIVSLRFRMDQYFEQLRSCLLEANLERGGDVVHTRKRQIIGHGAVARHVDFVAHALDLNLMHINNFGEFLHDRLELTLKRGHARNLIPGLDG